MAASHVEGVCLQTLFFLSACFEGNYCHTVVYMYGGLKLPSTSVIFKKNKPQYWYFILTLMFLIVLYFQAKILNVLECVFILLNISFGGCYNLLDLLKLCSHCRMYVLSVKEIYQEKRK